METSSVTVRQNKKFVIFRGFKLNRTRSTSEASQIVDLENVVTL